MRQSVSSFVGFLVCVLSAGSVQANPTCTDFGDRNGDCRIDLVDHAALTECMSGPGISADPRCICFDNDADNDVDMEDFRVFQQAFTGDQLITACDMTPAALEPAALHPPPVLQAMLLNAAQLDPGGILRSHSKGGGSSTWPVVFEGEYYYSAVDLTITSRGFDFVWSRKYRSKNGPATAMGDNWDFGYNISLEQAGVDLILHDGNSRADRYVRVSGPGGDSWCAADFFREITQLPDGSFVCTFPHRNVWRFHPLDGSPQAGRLSEMADPNGNTMAFSYDVAGRLTTVVDTLGRPVTIAYNVDDQVSSITDFAGRQVVYEYYSVLDTLGNEGDLKSVTSPVVVGTPNANDFPTGKTTVYSYSVGSPDNALNHNLLTITDAKGQTYLTNTYAPTLNPLDLEFDRLTRQVLGDPTDIIDYVYETESPTSTNGFAVTRTIINDRNGHVAELLFDKFNRCVTQRQLTGQADPNSPTSSTVNRPVNKLRATDPDAFETRFEYNGDSLLARVVDPEGSIAEYTYEGDTSFLAPTRNKANVTQSKLIAGPRGGDQSQIVTTLEYDANSNGATNKVTRLVDGRGNETNFDYDAAGNRTRTTHRIPSIVEDFEYNTFGQLSAHIRPDNGSGSRRRDEYVYYNAGPSTGYLQNAIVDAPGVALTTTYEYDLVGNILRTVDARGNDTLRTVNQLDQVVRTLSRPVDPGNSIRYEVDTFYDANDNVVRADVQNRDETHTLYPNAAITTLYDYDILDKCIRVTQEIDPGNNVVVEYEYDAQRNRVLVRDGEATNGTQPTNTTTTLYDERDLVFQEVLAVGDPSQSTTQYDYDGNVNVVRTAQGLEGNARVTTWGYDGYDRVMPTTDAMGNLKTCQYDENGNQVLHHLAGELLDVVGSAGNVRLSETSFTFDALDRRTRSDVEFFDATTQSPIGDGLSSTVTVYSDNSQVLSVTDDNNRVTTIQYDTANRPSVVTDAKNNTKTYTYDQNSNVLSVTETDKSDLGLSDEVFVTTFVYDRLDRVVSTTDSSGNTLTYGYDSRDNRVRTVDALSNETRLEYDGLDRVLTSTTDIDGDGADGDGTDIVVTRVWDDSSRLVQQTDDNGNSTVTVYDALNRTTLRNLADGTHEAYVYDPHHTVVARADANGSSFLNTYDLLNRLTNTNIILGAGVAADTTFETFTYDGLSRAVSSQDDDVTSSFAWTSLSDMTQETTDGQATTSIYDGVGNRLSCTYPSGRTFAYTYDTLNRLSTIHDGPNTLTSYLYVGADRVTMQQYGNGARTTFTYDGIQGVPNPPLDFGSKQVVGISHTSGPTAIDSRTFTWDQMYSKTERRDVRAAGPQLRHAYQYDSAYRMTSGLEEDGIGIVTRNTIYNLDGVGNRTSLGGFGGVTGPYLLDPISPPADFQVNQYTQTPRDDRLYDDNGNLASIVSPIGTTDYAYDAYDRPVLRVDSLSGDTATYVYDALGRRVRKTVTPGGGPPEEIHYFYDGINVIEDQDSNGLTLATYVRGARGNDIVCVESGGQVVYHHTDDAGNVMALTDSNGVAVERYEYDDFGAPSIFDGGGVPMAASSVGNQYMFAGELHDSETGWYYSPKGGYMAPPHGRYVTRDSGGSWDSSGGFGNAYTYAGANPWSTSRGRGNGNDGGIKVIIVAKMIANSGGSGSGHGHVTVLKAMARGGHRGHVTVLKAMGSGGGGGHVTILKAMARGGHRGHVTVLKARGGGGMIDQYVESLQGGTTRGPWKGGDYNSSRSNKSNSIAAGGGGHNGHVTVLKSRSLGGDYNSSRSNKSNSIAAGGHNPPSGKRKVKFKAGADLSKKVNIAGGGGGHMGTLGAYGRGAAEYYGNSSDVRAGGGGLCPPCGMWKAVCIQKGTQPTGQLKILPSCNNISSR